MKFIPSQVRKLKIAIILTALEDARAADNGAMEWLLSTAAVWVDELDILTPEDFKFGIKKVVQQAKPHPTLYYEGKRLRKAKAGTTN